MPEIHSSRFLVTCLLLLLTGVDNSGSNASASNTTTSIGSSGELVAGCLNPRSTFEDGQTDGWVASSWDDVKIEDKEGRNDVLALKKEDVVLSTDFAVVAAGIGANTYRVQLDVLGEDDINKRTLIRIVWLNAVGHVVNSEDIVDQSFDKNWQEVSAVVTAPLGATRGRLTFQNSEGSFWLDQVCITTTLDAGGGGGGSLSGCTITNGDFIFGTFGWEANAEEAKVKGGKLELEDGYIQQAYTPSPGIPYHLSFRYKSDDPIAVFVVATDDPSNSRRVYYQRSYGKWITANVVVYPVNSATSFYLRFEENFAEEIEIDEVCLTAMVTPKGECTLYNPDFNEGLAGWNTNREVESGVFEGRQSAKIKKQSYLQQRLSVSGGIPYELSYRVFGADKVDNVQIELLWRGPGAFIKDERVSQRTYAKSWTQERIQVIAPSEATVLYVRVRANTDQIYVDDICWQNADLEAGECVNINNTFEYGTAGWVSGGGATMTIASEASNKYLHVEQGYIATRRLPVRAAEEYYLNYRLREYGGATSLWNSIKWFDASRQLIREEPLQFQARGDTNWNDHEYRIIVPNNAMEAQLVFSLGSITIDLDDVCLSAGITRAGGCTNTQDVVSYWTRTDPGDGGEFEESFVDGQDALRLKETSVYTEFIAVPGHSYRTRFRLVGADNPSAPTSMSILWLDSGGSTLSTSPLDQASFPAQWQEVVYRATAPAGAVTGRVIIENDQAEIYFALYCSMDAGEATAASVISGRVWSDDDGDGVQKESELPMGGSKLVLYRDNGDGVREPLLDEYVAEAISSSADLEYFFTDLPAGSYYVVGYLLPTKRVSAFQVAMPDQDNDFEAKSIDGIAVGMTPLLAADGGNDLRDIDYGQRYSGKAAVSGFVWADADENRYRNEPNAAGLNGFELFAISAATGDTVATTITSDDQFGNPGFYLFNFVNPEPVYIEIKVPAGVTLLSARNDNRFNSSTFRSNLIPLAADVTVTNLSASMRVSGTEVCDNGVDDDGDGRIDDRDSDCTSCVVADRVICGDLIRYYVPPMWQMNDGDKVTYSGPSYLILSTTVGSANVTVRRGDGTVVSTNTVTNAGSAIVVLDENTGQTAANNTVENQSGLVVESDQPVQVIYTIQGGYNKALVTIKGQQALGNKFRAGSQVAQYDCDPTRFIGEHAVSKREAHFVSVMATEDNTNVTFEWDETALTLAGSITSPHTVMLQAGESYLVRDDYTNETVSGLGITSDKAVAVISGSQHTNVCDVGGLDAGIDQLVPECYVGTDYVLVKHAGLDNQHYGVIVGIADNTEIFIDGSTTPFGTVNEGEWLRLPITGNEGDAHYISTSAPAYVYHISGISANNEVGMGLASAVGDCRGNDYITFPRGSVGYDHKLNVIIDASDLASLTLNGAAVSGLPGVVSSPVIGNAGFSSVLVPDALVLANNVLQADTRFQAALLIGLDANSGTYGYLTSFAQDIAVIDPTTNAPGPRYSLPQVCGGDVFDHTIQANACGVNLEIVEISNNTAYGTVSLNGGLSFNYAAKPEAYGNDNISARIRDENGNERAVCIEVFVCGESLPILGLAPSQTLSCGSAIPNSSPYVVATECGSVGVISMTETEGFSACPNERIVTRVWTATSGCGTPIRAERTYYVVDDQAPVTIDSYSDATICLGESLPSAAPSYTDDCGGTVTVTETRDTTTFPGSNRLEIFREWTATDVCGNSASTSQLVNVLAAPVLTSAFSSSDATCGQSNGVITLKFPNEASRTQVRFAINGSWQSAVSTGAGSVSYNGYAAGTYTIRGRWSDSSCPVDLGTVTINTDVVSLGDLYFYDLDANTSQKITNGSTYHRQDLPARWNLTTTPSGDVGRLNFDISGGTVSDSKYDNSSPFRYPGDNTPLAWTFGTYEVDVEAYTQTTSGGAICATEAYNFTLINTEDCTDGVDNDGDNLVDCADEDCAGANPVVRVSRP